MEAPSPKPLPVTAPLGRDRANETKQRLTWGKRHMLASYDEVGLKDARWDAPARRFIEESIPPVLGGEEALPASRRIALGRAVAGLGCRDPLVSYLLGEALLDGTWDSAEPEYFFAQAVQGFKEVRYPRALARMAASGLYGRYEWRRQNMFAWRTKGLRDPLRELEIQWFEESFTDGSYEPGDSLVLLYQLTNGTGPAFFERSTFRASAALRRAPWVEPWIRLLFSGLHQNESAWRARGNGWAKNVSPDAWRRFTNLGRAARLDLAESWRLRPDRPQAASRMITVADDVPEPGETPRYWFDLSVAAQFDYLDSYGRMLTRLLPRWGGSYEGMLRFGREALETERFDTEVPLYCLGAVTRVYNDQKDDKGGEGGTPVYEQGETYPLLARVLSGYLAEPKQAASKARFEALWAVVADRAGRPLDALEHLRAADFRLTADAASHLEGELPDEFAARVALAAGPAAADARRADVLRSAFQTTAALSVYREALAEDSSPQTARGLRRWIAALETEERLETGDWIPFLPTSNAFEGWRRLLGSWRVERDGALTGEAGARGLLLVSDARVGPDFEMQGRIELVSSSNGFFQGGFAFGRPEWGNDTWFSFRVMRNAAEGSVAYFRRFLYPAPYRAPIVPLLEANDIAIRVEGGHMTARVNGQIAHEDFTPDLWNRNDRGAVLGFCGSVDENVTSVRFRAVRVRRLQKDRPKSAP